MLCVGDVIAYSVRILCMLIDILCDAVRNDFRMLSERIPCFHFFLVNLTARAEHPCVSQGPSNVVHSLIIMQSPWCHTLLHRIRTLVLHCCYTPYSIILFAYLHPLFPHTLQLSVLVFLRRTRKRTLLSHCCCTVVPAQEYLYYSGDQRVCRAAPLLR
jgi:hypothetical protein